MPTPTPSASSSCAREKVASAILERASAIAPMSGFLRRSERSEEHTSELQSQSNLVCRLLLEKKKIVRAAAYISPVQCRVSSLMLARSSQRSCRATDASEEGERLGPCVEPGSGERRRRRLHQP